ADVVVAQQPGLFDRSLDALLHPWAEGNRPEGHRRAASRQVSLDIETDLRGGEPHLLQDHQRDPVGLAKDGQDQVLGAEIVVLVPLGLFARQDDDLSALVGEPFKHPVSPPGRPCRRGESVLVFYTCSTRILHVFSKNSTRILRNYTRILPGGRMSVKGCPCALMYSCTDHYRESP